MSRGGLMLRSVTAAEELHVHSCRRRRPARRPAAEADAAQIIASRRPSHESHAAHDAHEVSCPKAPYRRVRRARRANLVCSALSADSAVIALSARPIDPCSMRAEVGQLKGRMLAPKALQEEKSMLPAAAMRAVRFVGCVCTFALVFVSVPALRAQNGPAAAPQAAVPPHPTTTSRRSGRRRRSTGWCSTPA